MFRRVLLIGVGGSGGKTLRFLHRDLLRRLDEANWTEGMPVGWQFLQIDVPPTPDGNDPGLPPQLPDGSYVGLTVPNVVYSALDRVLLPPGVSSRTMSECIGWRPDPALVKVDVTAGAGQYRTLGRVIALANINRINGAVARAMERLAQPQATGDLVRIGQLFGVPPSAQAPEPLAIVVSSIAGGSGAGTFLDICDVLKAQGESWAHNSVALLFAPDVFTEINPLGRSGVCPNALAAVSELMAGYWNAAPADADEYALYEPAGLALGPLKGRGPRYPFLIGRANSTVHFGLQEDVYAGTGAALAALLTSERAQDEFVSYLRGNWESAAGSLQDTLGLNSPVDETVFSSLGFSSVSLGRDRFARYASERLARLAAHHLLRAHWTPEVPEKVKPDAALADALQANFRWFVGESGLNELSEQRNDIIDGLRPVNQAALISQTSQQIITQIGSGGAQYKPAEWARALSNNFNQREPSMLDGVRVAADERARSEWAPAIQQRLVHLVAVTLGRVGAEVAVALLDALREELDKVMDELRKEEDLRRREALQRDSLIWGKLVSIPGGGKVPASNDFVGRANDEATKTLTSNAEANLRGLAVELILDLRDNLLAPLRKAVAESRDVLAREYSPPLGSSLRSPLSEWPADDLLPPRFEPSVNERLVEPPEEYPRRFTERLLQTVQASTPMDAVREAVRQVVVGTTPSLAQTALRQDGVWVPSRLGSTASAPSRAAFHVEISADDLLRRARDWVHRPGTSIGEHVGESLREYLGTDVAPAERDERLDRFRAAFTAAVDLAAPLVKINQNTLRRVHGLASPQISYSFTEIPLPKGTPGRDVVEAVLATRELDPQNPKYEKFFGIGDQSRIDILSRLEAPFEPVVFESLMDPIAADWMARKGTEATRAAFWRWRKSRPLTRFVPMSPGIRRNFVTGWFAARVIGQIHAERDDSEPVEVYVPSERRWLSFPFPLIAAVDAEVDLLPAVLESLPLALLDYATKGDPGDDAIFPYQRLSRLGAEPRPELRHWIETGTVVEGAPTPSARMGCADDAPDVRQKQVVDYLEERADSYAKHFETVDQHNFFALRWVWELQDDVRSAFAKLSDIAKMTQMEAGD